LAIKPNLFNYHPIYHTVLITDHELACTAAFHYSDPICWDLPCDDVTLLASRDDDRLVHAGAVLALEQRGPQVRGDGLGRAGRVEAHVQVAAEVAALELGDVVGVLQAIGRLLVIRVRVAINGLCERHCHYLNDAKMLISK